MGPQAAEQQRRTGTDTERTAQTGGKVDWSTGTLGFAAGVLIALVTAPVGVSGAVFLLPVQLSGQAERAQQLLNEVLRRFHLKTRAAALALASPRAVSRPRKPSTPDRTSAGGPRRV
ncbi:hypothetical protein GCM10027074_72860 [Streptomyces deserti]